MSESEQIRKIKCPRCGWVKTASVKVWEDTSLTEVVRGWGEALQVAQDRIEAVLRDIKQDEANAKFDVLCPNCGRTYHFNIHTGEVTL